jgi:MerR-like DNA binding protein
VAVLTLKSGSSQGDDMADATLSIGQVAAKAGINVSAIRYYERHGLLPEPDRVSGQRRYREDAVRRLAVIGAAKNAGFSPRSGSCSTPPTGARPHTRRCTSWPLASCPRWMR